ncbi:MAG: hypothetical protein ACLFVO_25900 [Chloroflexaceae bacterium]
MSETAGGQTTHYTQDLAAPLSQVLQIRQPDQTTDVLYGLERLGTVSSGSTTWTGGDALGSTRLTLDDAGAVVGPTSGACPEQREGTRGVRPPAASRQIWVVEAIAYIIVCATGCETPIRCHAFPAKWERGKIVGRTSG